MAEGLIKAMRPMHERRAHFEAQPERVKEIIATGSEKARTIARQTMAQVRAAIRIRD